MKEKDEELTRLRQISFSSTAGGTGTAAESAVPTTGPGSIAVGALSAIRAIGGQGPVGAANLQRRLQELTKEKQVNFL